MRLEPSRSTGGLDLDPLRMLTVSCLTPIRTPMITSVHQRKRGLQRHLCRTDGSALSIYRPREVLQYPCYVQDIGEDARSLSW
jgi:hypothetical protein